MQNRESGDELPGINRQGVSINMINDAVDPPCLILSTVGIVAWLYIEHS